MSYVVKNLSQGSRELIAFRIGNQEFCVSIMSVREIRGWTPATKMPHSPAYMMGVLNLRGAVLPIVDLAARLGMRPAEPTPRHAIIVTQLGSQIGGWIVDSVSDIVTVPDEAMQPPPPASGSDTVVPFLDGLAAIEDKMVMVLNLAALADSDSMAEAA